MKRILAALAALALTLALAVPAFASANQNASCVGQLKSTFNTQGVDGLDFNSVGELVQFLRSLGENIGLDVAMFRALSDKNNCP